MMSMSQFCLAVFILATIFINTNGSAEYEYGMVIDAGSTHSALYIYRFEDRVTSNNIPPQSSPVQIAESEDQGPISELENQAASDTLISVNYISFQIDNTKKIQYETICL